MADDRLPCCRAESISATRADKVMSRPPAITFSPLQNASSRLTLVLWSATGSWRSSATSIPLRGVAPFSEGLGRLHDEGSPFQPLPHLLQVSFDRDFKSFARPCAAPPCATHALCAWEVERKVSNLMAHFAPSGSSFGSSSSSATIFSALVTKYGLM